ncbi:hypothetical protein LXL04_011892 [Taraxacum kok-saghyz]
MSSALGNGLPFESGLNLIAKLSESAKLDCETIRKIAKLHFATRICQIWGYIHQIEIQGAHRACAWTGGIICFQIGPVYLLQEIVDGNATTDAQILRITTSLSEVTNQMAASVETKVVVPKIEADPWELQSKYRRFAKYKCILDLTTDMNTAVNQLVDVIEKHLKEVTLPQVSATRDRLRNLFSNLNTMFKRLGDSFVNGIDIQSQAVESALNPFLGNNGERVHGPRGGRGPKVNRGRGHDADTPHGGGNPPKASPPHAKGGGTPPEDGDNRGGTANGCIAGTSSISSPSTKREDNQPKRFKSRTQTEELMRNGAEKTAKINLAGVESLEVERRRSGVWTRERWLLGSIADLGVGALEAWSDGVRLKSPFDTWIRGVELICCIHNALNFIEFLRLDFKWIRHPFTAWGLFDTPRTRTRTQTTDHGPRTTDHRPSPTSQSPIKRLGPRTESDIRGNFFSLRFFWADRVRGKRSDRVRGPSPSSAIKRTDHGPSPWHESESLVRDLCKQPLIKLSR